MSESSFSYTSGCAIPVETRSRFVLYSSSTVKNRSGIAAVAVLPGSALTSSTWPPDSVSIRIPPCVAAVVREAGADEVHVPGHVLHRVGAAVDRDHAAAGADERLQVRELGEVQARRVQADGRVHDDRLVLLSVARSRNGLVASETPAGACRPGDVPAVRVPDVDVEAVLGAELLEHRLRVDDRLVAEAAGAAVDEDLVRRPRVGHERGRVPEHADRLVARIRRRRR